MKLFLLHFIISVTIMGAFTYFYFHPPVVYYLFLLPYGFITYSMRMNRQKKWRRNMYDEIDSINNSALIKAMPMNYWCKLTAENGIGYIYPTRFTFKSYSNEMKLTIPLANIAKVEPYKFWHFFAGIHILLKDGNIKKFVIDEDRQNEFIECIRRGVDNA